MEVYKETESKVSISAQKTIQFLLETRDFAHTLYGYGKQLTDMRQRSISRSQIHLPKWAKLIKINGRLVICFCPLLH